MGYYWLLFTTNLLYAHPGIKASLVVTPVYRVDGSVDRARDVTVEAAPAYAVTLNVAPRFR